MAFAQAATAAGLRPITGADIGLESGGRITLLAENRQGYGTLSRLISAAHLHHDKGEPALPDQLLQWVSQPEAIALPQAKHGAGLLGLAAPAPLPVSDAPGIICLLGRASPVGRALDAGDLAAAERQARHYLAWFGAGQLWFALQQNLVRGDTRRIRLLVELGERLDIPCVATNDVRYHLRQRHRLLAVQTAIKHRTTLAGSHRQRLANSEFFLKSPAEMAALFRDRPAAIGASRAIAERCQFQLARDLDYAFPSATAVAAGLPDDEALEQLCRRELERRYPLVIEGNPQILPGTPAATPELRATAYRRLHEELALVQKHRLSGFLLVYHDILRMGSEVAARLRHIDPASPHKPNPGRGRGSSVSSLVCYLIGLSHIDPVRNELFFGRFLNDEMRSVPDIDLDFPRDIREQLILAVYERYGHDHAALVCTFPTYRVRSAIREVGKVLELPAVELDRLAKLSEGGSARSLADEVAANPTLRHRGQQRSWQLLIELAWQIAGFPRHVSQHVGGMIVSSRPLVDLVPVEHARMDGRFVCQWDKDSVDDARFIKIDFLALGMLSLVDECLDLITTHHGQRPDLSRIDFEDQHVYDMICEADTTGLFQIESRAQMSSLPSTQPRSLEDLAVQVAIVRPGPIIGGAFKPYLAYRRRLNGVEESPYLTPNLIDEAPLRSLDQVANRGAGYGSYPFGESFRNDGLRTPRDPTVPWHQWRHSASEAPVEVRPTYLHPLLEPVLKRTAGVILFQEQILQVAMAVADFTSGEAERLRRAIGRKNAEAEVEKLRQRFEAGARANGLSDEVIGKIFHMFLGFASFGFPESHAHAFGLLAYHSAWLRRYYPEEFFTALLNNQPMGFYPPHVLVHYARRNGMRFLRPSINAGHVSCEIVPIGRADGGHDRLIRLGYGYVQGVNKRWGETIEAARAAGPFPSLDDFLQRTRLPREAIEALIATGAFDDLLAPAARSALTQLDQDAADTALGRRQLLWRLGEIVRPMARQLALPNLLAGLETPALAPITTWEQMTADYQLLGLSPEHHPMGLIRSQLPPQLGTSRDLEQAQDGQRLTVSGMVTTRQRPQSAGGVVFMTMEDEFGKIDLIIQKPIYARYRSLVRGEPFIVVHGVIQRRDRLTVHLRVTHLARLPFERAAPVPVAHDMLPPAAHNFGQGSRR